jgi:hypothetical protein
MDRHLNVGESGTPYRLVRVDRDRISLSRPPISDEPLLPLLGGRRVTLHMEDITETITFLEHLNVEDMKRQVASPPRGQPWSVVIDQLKGIALDHVRAFDPEGGYLILLGFRDTGDGGAARYWLAIVRGDESLAFPVEDRAAVYEALGSMAAARARPGCRSEASY